MATNSKLVCMSEKVGVAHQCSRAVDDPAIAWRTVIDLRGETIWMFYNCHYMTNICKNIENFKATARGRNLHPGTSIPAGTFTYDFDIADAGARSRADLRRDQSCPGNWKDTHTCPEAVGQQTLWRHDGPWWTTALEPNTGSNMLRHERNAQGQITKLSQMRYSCEEWPRLFLSLSISFSVQKKI